MVIIDVDAIVESQATELVTSRTTPPPQRAAASKKRASSSTSKQRKRSVHRQLSGSSLCNSRTTSLPTITESDSETVHSKSSHSREIKTAQLYIEPKRTPPPQAWKHSQRGARRMLEDVEEGFPRHSDTSDSSSDDGDTAVAVPLRTPSSQSPKNSRSCCFTRTCCGVSFTVRFLIVLVVVLLVVTAAAVVVAIMTVSSDGSGAKTIASGQVSSTSDGNLAATRTFPSIYINAGGTMNGPDDFFVDSGNRTWVSDEAAAENSIVLMTNSGKVYQQCPSSIKNTHDDALYCSERWFGGPVAGTYEIPVDSNDTYQVVLHFAELYYSKAGQRLFDINIEGRTVRTSFDIFAAAGGPFTATRVFAMTDVTDGSLTIELVPVKGKGNPKINAIEVHHHSVARSEDSYLPYDDPVSTTKPEDESVATPGIAPTSAPAEPTSAPVKPAATDEPSTFVPILINCGGLAVTTSDKLVWQSDFDHPEFIVGEGISFYDCPANITGTQSDELYCSERWFDGPGGYEIPVPATGQYNVTLHFAELFYNATGERVFNVAVEGNTLRSNFDIIKAAGGAMTATTLTTTVDVSDGDLSIGLLSVNGNAKINAISVYRVTL
jgi:Malectin domain